MGYHKLDELQTAPDHTSLRVILRDSARAQKLLPAYDLRTLESTGNLRMKESKRLTKRPLGLLWK